MNDELELQQYVDWLSLEYYDKRIKDYIDVRCTEDLRIGGEVSASWLNIAPVAENQNKLFIVIDAFTTGETFFESNIDCDRGTVVYLSSTEAGLKYKLLDRVVPADSSLSDAIVRIDHSIGELTDRIELLKTDHAASVETQNNIAKELEVHKKDSSYKFDAVDTAIQTIHDELKDAEANIQDVRNDIEHVADNLQTINHDIHDLLHSHETRLNNFEGAFATKESVENLEEKIDSIPQVSLEGYATEDYVQDQISGILIPDMSDYATVEDVDVKLAALIDGAPAALNTLAELAEAIKDQEDVLVTFATKAELSDVATSGSYTDLKDTPVIPSVEGLASEEYVAEAIKNIPSVDLSDYAKKEDIPDVSRFLSEIPAEYVTETELDSKGFLTQHQDLSSYALKTDIPTDISKFNNDAGYLTEHQSLEGLATEEFVRDQIGAIPETDVSGLATKDELSSKADKSYVDEAISNVSVDLTGYATEDFVKTEIANAQLGGDEGNPVDLSHLATKTELTAAEERILETISSIQYGTF